MTAEQGSPTTVGGIPHRCPPCDGTGRIMPRNPLPVIDPTYPCAACGGLGYMVEPSRHQADDVPARRHRHPDETAGRIVTIVPLTLAEAQRYVAEHHRHNEPPVGHRFSIGLRREDGTLAGVVIAGHPVARKADDGLTIELVRLTTVGDRNACSRLYGAACRAAQAMGYRRAITYTLADEPGSSLRASGFVIDRVSGGGEWKHSDGPRAHDKPTLFDPPKMPTGPKVRWVREFALTRLRDGS